MCLVVIAHRVHERLPLIVAGNRDEFHARPTQDAHWWPDAPDVLGGRDRQAGGTWLAISRRGRLATVTNYRDAEPPRGNLRSRGHLITDFLAGNLPPLEYLAAVKGDDYAGFNLIVADGARAAYLSNRGGGLVELSPGIYGVANATLDIPWAKTERSKAALESLIDSDRVNETHLLEMLADRCKASVDEVESGRLPFAKAHAMTAPFIVQPDYGTRCSSVVLRNIDWRVRFTEKRFRADGEVEGRSDFEFVAAS